MTSTTKVIELLKQDKIAIENDCKEKLPLLQKIFKECFTNAFLAQGEVLINR